jgi:pilus assembly protein CpaF
MSAFGRKNGIGGMQPGARPSFGVAKPMKSGVPMPGQGSAPGGGQFPPLPGEMETAPPPPPSGGAANNRADAMSRLADRANAAAVDGNSEVAGFEASVHKIKEQVLPRLLERVDPEAAATLSKDELSEEFRPIIMEVLTELKVTLNRREQFALEKVLIDELLGFGPLEELLNDPDVSDIMVNGPLQTYIEKKGKLQIAPIQFRDEQHLFQIAQRIVNQVGRRVDQTTPLADARLKDGSRVNAVIPPLAIDGPSLSIRRFAQRPLTGEELVKNGALSADMLAYLRLAVRARCSILVSGGTGAGKTTLLNLLSSFISKRERIITAEDAAELRLQQPHVVRLEARPANLEGKGAVSIRDLVKNALRMRPDRILVGEVRGAEVLDMLQAMNTGHDGSMATVHANSPDDAMNRLMTMLGMTGTPLAETTMASMIARSVHVVVQVARMQDGKRRITSIAEVAGQAGAAITLHQVYGFERTGTTSDGTVIGRHVLKAPTVLTEKFRVAGLIDGATSGELVEGRR